MRPLPVRFAALTLAAVIMLCVHGAVAARALQIFS